MIREEGYGSSGISPSSWIAAFLVSVLLHASLVGGVLLWQRYYKPKRIFIPTYTVALLGPQVVQQKSQKTKTVPPKRRAQVKKEVKKSSPPPEKKSKTAWKLPKEKKKVPPKKKAAKKPAKKREKTKKKKVEKKSTKKKAKKATKNRKKKVVKKKPVKKQKKQQEPAPDAQIAKALAKISKEVGQVKPGRMRGTAVNPRAVETRFQSYYNSISQKVREAWVLPPEVDEQAKLEAIVTITIEKDGSLKKVELETTSGNVFFDRSVLRAVRKAAPFAPLPKDYPGDEMEVGIRFRP